MKIILMNILLFLFLFSYDFIIFKYIFKINIIDFVKNQCQFLMFLLIFILILNCLCLPFITIYIIYIILEMFFIIKYAIKNYTYFFRIKLIIIRIFIDIIVFFLMEFLFDYNLLINQFELYTSLKLFWIFCTKYCQSIFYYFIINHQTRYTHYNLRYFKISTILLSFFYGISIILNNTNVFYFKSIGRTMVFTLIVYNAALIAFDRYQVKHERIEKEFAEKEKQFALVQQKQKIQDEYNQLLEREQQHVRNIHHDMNNHLMAMLGYIDRQDIDGVRKYVNDLLDESKRASQKVYTGHVSVDAILDAKILKARSLGIDVKESFEVVSFGIMKCVDLTKLLGCALDNAIEAILRIEDDTKKRLKIRMYNNGPYLIVCIGNSIAKGIDVDFSHTSKTYDEKNHGFGVKDIKSIAFEYDGSAYYEFEKDFVMLNVILYVKRDV